MFARDVITRQALESHLLDNQVQNNTAFSPSVPEDEILTPECAEEFEQTCESLVPFERLALPDLQEQFQYALVGQRVK